mmetsp:Transcript_33770/g.107902  ORF Transcript_33770/g.107902 Transcript_33770/m.107902 type:complete len:261 (-) Transcript_33770:1113-1895(-)
MPAPESRRRPSCSAAASASLPSFRCSATSSEKARGRGGTSDESSSSTSPTTPTSEPSFRKLRILRRRVLRAPSPSRRSSPRLKAAWTRPSYRKSSLPWTTTTTPTTKSTSAGRRPSSKRATTSSGPSASTIRRSTPNPSAPRPSDETTLPKRRRPRWPLRRSRCALPSHRSTPSGLLLKSLRPSWSSPRPRASSRITAAASGAAAPAAPKSQGAPSPTPTTGSASKMTTSRTLASSARLFRKLMLMSSTSTFDDDASLLY